jgi:hypothetical protein
MVAFVGHKHSNTIDKYYNQISIERIRVELEKFSIPKIKVDQAPSKSPLSIVSLLAS